MVGVCTGHSALEVERMGPDSAQKKTVKKVEIVHIEMSSEGHLRAREKSVKGKTLFLYYWHVVARA